MAIVLATASLSGAEALSGVGSKKGFSLGEGSCPQHVSGGTKVQPKKGTSITRAAMMI
jgi:hypothetical protein